MEDEIMMVISAIPLLEFRDHHCSEHSDCSYADLIPIPVDHLPTHNRSCRLCSVEYIYASTTNIIEANKREIPKVLPCGHMFGHICIQKHIDRGRNRCPTCDRVISGKNIRHLLCTHSHGPVKFAFSSSQFKIKNFDAFKTLPSIAEKIRVYFDHSGNGNNNTLFSAMKLWAASFLMRHHEEEIGPEEFDTLFHTSYFLVSILVDFFEQSHLEEVREFGSEDEEGSGPEGEEDADIPIILYHRGELGMLVTAFVSIIANEVFFPEDGEEMAAGSAGGP